MRPLRASAVAVAAVLLAACAETRPPPAPVRLDYDGFSATLPSGLRVVAYRLAGAPRTTVVSSVAAGDADDPPGKEGLARLVARLTRRAAPGAGGFSLAERAFAAGAVASLATEPDELRFAAIGKPGMLDELLAIEADRLHAPLAGVDARTFEAERDALAAELAREESPVSRAVQARWFVAAAAPSPDDGRPPPSAATVRALTLEDARTWARERFVPSRTILVVMGPDAPREVTRRVAVAAAALDASPAEALVTSPIRVSFPEPPPGAAPGPLVRRRVAVSDPWLWVGWTLPAVHDEDARVAAGALASRATLAWLWGHTSGWLDVEPFFERRRAVAIVGVRAKLRSADDADAVASAIVAAAGGAGPRPWGGEGGALANAVDSFAARSAHDQAVSGAWRALETGDGSAVARAFRATGNPDAYFSELRRGTDATPGALYARWIRAERRVAVLFAPDGSTGSAPEIPARATEGWPLTGAGFGAAAPGPERVRTILDPPPLDGSARWRLANGLEVTVAPAGEFPTVRAELVLRLDPERARGANAALHASRRPWSPVAPEWCAAPDPRVEDDHVAFEVEAVATRLDEAIDELACAAGRRVVDGDALRHSAAALAALPRGVPGVRAFLAAYAAAYPGAYGRVEDRLLGAAAPDQAERLLRDALRPDRALLVLSGHVTDTPALRARIADAFARWAAPATPATVAAPPPLPPARRVLLADAPGSARALVSILVRLPPAAGADAAALLAVADHVAARLALRGAEGEKKSVVVGGPPAYPVLSITVRTDPAVAVEVVRGVLGELARPAEAPLSDVAVNYARWLVALDFAYRFDTSAGIVRGVDDLFAAGLPPDAWEGFPASLAALDAPRMLAAARATAIGREIVTVVGDAKSLEPALRAAGFAPELLPRAAGSCEKR